MSGPDLDLARVRRFCETKIPEHARHQVRLETTVRGNSVTVVERRAPWREVAAHPCAWHVAYLPEVLSEIAETHRRIGQYDAAIQAWREAIKFGYSSNPLPECNIAELLLESGHREQADDL